MLDYNADGLSDQDIERLAALMAKDPKFAHELADAIATRLDEKYGFRQGEIIDDIEKVSGKIDGLSSKLDAMGHRFSTLEHNFGVFGQKLDLIGRRTEKMDKRLERVEDRVGNIKVKL